MLDSKQVVFDELYTAAFCGLHSTRPFKISFESSQEILQSLVGAGIRIAFMISEGFIVLSCFTTGISIDHPFDMDQI